MNIGISRRAADSWLFISKRIVFMVGHSQGLVFRIVENLKKKLEIIIDSYENTRLKT
jgi:hypothetical protein